MAQTQAPASREVAETGAGSSVKVSHDTKAALDRLARRLDADSLGDLIAFLARHFESSSHFSRFVDLREFHALADRLHAVLLFLATTNLELGQHLRRMHSGHYRRLAQYADELVAVHNRLLAQTNAHPGAKPARTHA